MSQYLVHNDADWDKIEHIVVLMLENRSFDNLLGWLYEDGAPNDQYFDGLNKELWNPMSNLDANGTPFVEQVWVRKNGEAPAHGSYAALHEVEYTKDFCQPDPDPGEGYKDTNHQLFGVYDVDTVYPPDPTNLGFVDNYKNAMLYGTYCFGDAPTDPRAILNCYTPDETRVLSALAQQFAVCDQWFCPVPSQTWPNRAFAFAATSDGNVNNRPDWVATSKTIFDQLTDAGKSWKVYHGVQWNKSANDGEGAVQPFSLTQIMLDPAKATAYAANFQIFDEFYNDVSASELPAYTFLEPQFSTIKNSSGVVVAQQNDQHPPSDIRDGEQLIADVYEALRDSELWDKTLLVITYDEHGGCYDHIAPGTAKAPIASGSDAGPVDPFFGFRFNRYGLRVPAVLVSPWIPAGTVARPQTYSDPSVLDSGQTTARYFDHTSVIASVRNKFKLEGYLTDRDRYAPDLSCVLTLDEPRSDKPAVTPAAAPQADLDRESHLMNAISEHLVSRTGQARKPGEVSERARVAYPQSLGRLGLRRLRASNRTCG